MHKKQSLFYEWGFAVYGAGGKYKEISILDTQN